MDECMHTYMNERTTECVREYMEWSERVRGEGGRKRGREGKKDEEEKNEQMKER